MVLTDYTKLTQPEIKAELAILTRAYELETRCYPQDIEMLRYLRAAIKQCKQAVKETDND